MTDEAAGLHLVLGDEELLVERAVAAVLRQARKQAGTDDVPVNRMRAGEVSTSELAELLSPSLFAEQRVVVLEAAGEAGKPGALNLAVSGDFDDQVLISIDGVEVARSSGKAIAIDRVVPGLRKISAHGKRGGKDLETARMIDVKPGLQELELTLS